jgi:hypothetical protein
MLAVQALKAPFWRHQTVLICETTVRRKLSRDMTFFHFFHNIDIGFSTMYYTEHFIKSTFCLPF